MERKDEIIQVTFKLFAQKGYNTTMSDIAKQVGIKVPSLYSHFESKDEIIYLAMTMEISEYFKTVQKGIELLEKEECETKVKGICFLIFTYFREIDRIRFWKNISLIHHVELRDKSRELIREQELAISQIITEIFEEGSKQGIIKKQELDGYVLLYMTMIQGILDTILLYHDTDFDIDEYIGKIWIAYWEAIKE